MNRPKNYEGPLNFALPYGFVDVTCLEDSKRKGIPGPDHPYYRTKYKIEEGVWTMIARFDCIVTIDVTCSLCHIRENCLTSDVKLGEHFARFAFPSSGWRLINGKNVCPKHTIELSIDKQKIEYFGEE